MASTTTREASSNVTYIKTLFCLLVRRVLSANQNFCSYGMQMGEVSQGPVEVDTPPLPSGHPMSHHDLLADPGPPVFVSYHH